METKILCDSLKIVRTKSGSSDEHAHSHLSPFRCGSACLLSHSSFRAEVNTYLFKEQLTFCPLLPATHNRPCFQTECAPTALSRNAAHLNGDSGRAHGGGKREAQKGRVWWMQPQTAGSVFVCFAPRSGGDLTRP